MARPPIGAAIERLQSFVQDLERLEQLLHSDDSPPPTLAEHRLYMLIIRHVKLYIILFYVKRSGLSFHRWLLCCDDPVSPSDEKEELIFLLLETYCGKNSVISRGVLSGEQVCQKIEQVGDLLFMFNALLKKSRNHLSKLYSPPMVPSLAIVGDDISSKEFKDFSERSDAKKGKNHEGSGTNFREQCLLNILRGLECIGRNRYYAPPADEEIQYYKSIRRRVTSYLEFMEAKPGWQSLLRKWHSVTKEAQGMEPWHSFYRGPSSYGLSYAPVGHKLASALDEFPDFLWILRECKCHFIEILSCLYKGEKLVIDDGCCRLSENREDQGYISLVIEERSPSFERGNTLVTETDYENVVGNEHKVRKKTREKHLQDILKIFKQMASLDVEKQLQVPEVRLYAQIVEHVTSSIWMYSTLQGVKKKYEETCDPVGEESADDEYDLSETDEEITREKYLIKIVKSIESIRSSFLDVPPTEDEIVHYNEIHKQLNTDLLNLKFSCLGQENEHRDTSSLLPSSAMWKQLLIFVYDWELIQLKEVEEDLREMVRSIYSKFLKQDPVLDPLKFIEEYFNSYKLRKQAIYELADPFIERPHGLKVLDRLILILTKMETLFDSFQRVLVLARKNMDSLTVRGMDKEVLLEILSSIEVLRLHPSSPVVSKCFWGRCRAMEVPVPAVSGVGSAITGKDKRRHRAREDSTQMASLVAYEVCSKDQNQDELKAFSLVDELLRRKLSLVANLEVDTEPVAELQNGNSHFSHGEQDSNFSIKNEMYALRIAPRTTQKLESHL